MRTKKSYNTKQMRNVLEVIHELKDSFFTISELSKRLVEKGYHVGLTTVYRNVERLEAQGYVAKIHIEGINGTCYKYQDNEPHFSLKCEDCGNVVELNCGELTHLYDHVSTEHNIDINPSKTMFYGTCDKCKHKNNTGN